MGLAGFFAGLVRSARKPSSTELVRAELRTLLAELPGQEGLLTAFCRGNTAAIDRLPVVKQRLEVCKTGLALEPDLRNDLDELLTELQVMMDQSRTGVRDSIAPYLTGARQCCRRLTLALDPPVSS